MRPPGKSKSWVYELIVVDKDDSSLKYCSLCPPGTAAIKCGSKSRTNTSNLQYHLTSKHRDEADEAKERFKDKERLAAELKRSHMGESHYVQTTIKQTLAKKVKWSVKGPRAK